MQAKLRKITKIKMEHQSEKPFDVIQARQKIWLDFLHIWAENAHMGTSFSPIGHNPN